MHWTLKIKKESSAVGSSYGGCVAIGDVMSTSSEGRTTADEYLSGNVREFLSTSSARRTTGYMSGFEDCWEKIRRLVSGEDERRDAMMTGEKIPCSLCRYAPPSAGDEKPCTCCPAEGV